MEPSHYDLGVILAVSFAIQVGGLLAIIVIGWRGLRELAAMVAEAQRLTRAVAGLVVQEEDRTRALFRESRG